MDSVKFNFLHNSSISYVLSVELLNAFIVNDFQLHSIADNICIFDKSMFVALVNTERYLDASIILEE